MQTLHQAAERLRLVALFSDSSIDHFTALSCPRISRAIRRGWAGSIATLVFSVARRKDLKQFKATLDYLKQRIDQVPQQMWQEYASYYQAQALFQGDMAAWEKWNKLLVRQLKQAQAPDGSFRGQLGGAVSTSLSLLALAVNFRFLPIYER